MNCTQCGTESPPGQRFCTVCGRELSLPSPPVCGRCGFANDPAANFCGGCGLVLRPAAAAAVEEGPRLAPYTPNDKRQITAMFCDLVDSTGLARVLDPEDYRTVLSAYQQACASVIADFGGYVAQYLGDGVLAYFGYPKARRDDAQRAVYAGLRVIAAVSAVHPGHGLMLRTRVGVATGLVVVGGEEGSQDGGARTVVGEAPHLAARLQSLSRPNSVVIGAATRSLLGGDVACEGLGAHMLKGFARPIEAWRVVSEHPVPEHVRRTRPSPAIPLVGRSEELAVLTRCASRLKDGAGQVVLIRGEAGVGKWRLAQEIVQWLSDRSSVWSIELCCSPRHTESAYYPLVQCLNQFFFAGRRPPEVVDAWSGIQRLLGELALDEPAEISPLFAQLLSVPLPFVSLHASPTPLTPERQQRLIQQSLLSLMLRRAEGKPLLLVIRDLQWADPSTQDFVDFLATQVASLPVLCLLTAHPDFSPHWFLSRSVTLVPLGRLDATEARRMMALAAGAETLDSAMTAALLERSSGLPLYIEELTKAVVLSRELKPSGESAVAAVPEAFHEAVMYRLEQSEEAREVARFAAVLGHEFRLPELSGVWPDASESLSSGLATLLQFGLVESRGGAAEGRYVFRHPLIRDAVYASLQSAERVARHAGIAGMLERDFPERAAAEPEILAQHFAAADMTMRAVTCLERAGHRALELGSHAEAGTHFVNALRLLAALPEGADRNRLELDLLVQTGLSLSVRCGYAAAEVETTYDRARELCRLRGDKAELYPVLRGLSTFYLVRAKLPTARELAEECVRLGKDLQRIDYLIGSYDVLGYSLLFAGELVAARAALLEGLDLYRAHDDGQYVYLTPQHPAVAYCCLLAIISWMGGDDGGASRYMREALDLADRLQRPFDQAYAHYFAALLETLRRNPVATLEHANIAIELSQHHGYAVWLQAGTLQLAIAEGLRGGGGEAINLLITTLQTWRASGAELNRAFFLAGLAEVYRANGRLDEALATVEEAIEHACRHDEHVFDALLFQLRGELLALAEPADNTAAEAQLRQAIATAQRQGASLFELRAATSLHKLCVARGPPEVSRAALERSCETVGRTSGSDRLPELHDARAQLGKTLF